MPSTDGSTTPNVDDSHSNNLAIRACCPKCMYDLQGSVTAWNTQSNCPLFGKCSECGHCFEWCHAVQLSGASWFFESHWKKQPIRTLIQTLGRSLQPWNFWREVQLNWMVRLHPLLVMIISMTFIVWLSTAVCLWKFGFPSTNPQPQMPLADIAIRAFTRSPLVWSTMTWAASGAIAMYYYAAQLSKPIFICPPHVTRVVCYSIAIVLPLSFPLTFVAAWASPEIEQTAPWLKVGFLYVGRSVIWILRMIFNVPGMNPKDAGLFTATTLPGFFFIPFWWCASARYFKSEMPGGIAWAGASIAMVLVTCFAVATLI